MDYPELSEIEKSIQEDEGQMIRKEGEVLKRKVAEHHGEYSETIGIKPNGLLDLEDTTGMLKSSFAHMGHEGTEDLDRLAHGVQRIFPELTFTFERDVNGQSLTYTVRESPEK